MKLNIKHLFQVKYMRERLYALGFALLTGGVVFAFFAISIHHLALPLLILFLILGITYFWSYKAFIMPITYWKVTLYGWLTAILTMALCIGLFTVAAALASKDTPFTDIITGLPIFILVTLIYAFLPSIIYSWIMTSLFYLVYRLCRWL